MKLIATTKVGNFPVKIYESAETKSHQAYGLTGKSPDCQEIHVLLDPEMSPDLYWETFWHEMVHVFEQGYGYELDHAMVNVMGMCLAQAMQGMKWKGKPASKIPAGLEATQQLKRRKKK